MHDPEPPAGGGDTSLRAVISQSWKRSSACGVDHGVAPELPYTQDFDQDSRLIRAAQPVLDRLVESMSDTHHSVFLADGEARVLQRWVGMKTLSHTLDKSHVAPGFSFPEELAGTNAVGTALEESKVVVVHGAEHYAEFLRNFSCVGVPIRHPITRSVQGILDFTCLAKDFNPLMRPLLVEVAKHIETRLSQQSSAAEMALLEQFVHTCHSVRGPVVAMRPELVLTNTAAAELLGSTDQAVLWDTATTLMTTGRDTGTVALAAGRFRMRLTTVEAGPRSDPGLVVRLAPERTNTARTTSVVGRTRPADPALVGRSRQWELVRQRIEDLAVDRRPIAVTGESGTGKLHVAKQLHRLSGQSGRVRLFDSALDGPVNQHDVLREWREALDAGDTVIARRIDLLPSGTLDGLGQLVRRGAVPGRLIVTSDDSSARAERVVAAFPNALWLPPLRQRSEDIADLIPALLAELAPGCRTRCSLPAAQAIMRYPWPGNVTELRDVLAIALSAAGPGEIELKHLPAWILKRAHRRRFTPMEQSERDLIIETLASVHDNRTEAARVLGIGRATLYRKLRSLGITTGRELAR